MGTSLRALAIEYDAALAAGDRTRALGIFKRIRQLLGNLNADQVQGVIEVLRGLFGELFPDAANEAQGLAIAFSVEDIDPLNVMEAKAASGWLTLLTLLVRIIRAAKG